MNQYIKKDKVLSLLGLDHNDYVYIDKRELAKKIEKLKGIDAVSVVHGEWKVSCKDSICSVCGKDEAEFICGTEDWYGYGLSNFCPNCGADMRKENER